MALHRAYILSAVVTLACTSLLGAADGKLKFNQDIRPILSDKCFHCHGPDSKKREADMRLDVREAAIKDKAIVPGKPEESEIIARILTEESDDLMPPVKSKLGTLTKEEIATLKRWIAEGAEYEDHWAFIPVREVPVPEVTAPDLRNPIDHLVANRLAERQLKMQPEASRETLIRRLAFDLTGLPPTPAEVEAFLKDSDPGAYEKTVDRLLQSERYGERMAVDWLDVSRYADSYGFQVDRGREVWPWRDWVINSFNANLSFDKFVTWQLAGDLLPDPTDEQILATAFNRLHQQESEGGSVEEEYRVEYVADRVQTFATAFLGLTFECARCHDHKFDPIPQTDYYKLFAMFQNVDEAGLYSFFTPSPPTPALMLMDGGSKEKMAALTQKVVAAEKQLAPLRDSRRSAFAEWVKTRSPEITIPGELGRFTFDAMEKDKLANTLDVKQPAILKGENKLVPGHSGKAVHFTGDDPVNLSFGNFKRHEPFSVSLWIKTPDVKDRAVVFHRSKAWTDAASRGYELLIEDGKLKWSLIHFWPGNAISIRAKDQLPINTWINVTVSSDGSSQARGLSLYVNGKPADVEVLKDALTKDITGGGGDNISLGERFRDRGFKNGVIDEFRVFSRAVTPLEAMALHDAPTAKGTKEESLWQDYYLATVDAEWKKQQNVLKAARAEQMQFAEGIKEIMVMKELPIPKKAYLLFRGQYNERRDEVVADSLDVTPPFPAGAPKNRLGLAQSLLSPEHPLFARVTVNRFWQSLFGYGLVKTSNDFGSQASLPVYPEVLDWLAWNFRKSGWDVKALMKTMVMSHTYRQRSIADPQVMMDDPENDWLARGPRFRLPAEMIRDNALAAAGLLKHSLGGAPVNAYEMSEAFKPVGASGGDGVYRRSLYSDLRRTSPPPAMLAFDAPSRAVCIAKRERTDSPLQSLILLNGVQYVEAARVLGEKLHRETKGDARSMITQGFMTCLSRKPDDKEMSILQQLYKEQLAYFKKHAGEAEALLKTGNAKRDSGIPLPEAAAATVLAQTLMNHDACVVKR